MNSSFLTPRRILIGIAVVALLLIVRFCTQNSGPEGPSELSIRYEAAPSKINPFLSLVFADIYPCARIFQTMGDLDPATLTLVPIIIKQVPQVYEVTDGPHKGELAADVEIIPEAAWDNGTPVTAKDIEFSLKLVFHPLIPSKAYLSYFDNISEFKIDPANPKKFTIYYKDYYFMAVEGLLLFPIMPAYNYDPGNKMTNVPLADFLDSTKLKAFTTDPNMKAFADEFQQPKFLNDPNFVTGSGPYRIETINDQGLILVKKENWWGDKVAERVPLLAAYPNKIIYKVVKDENVVFNMLKNEQLDIVAGSFSPAKYFECKNNDSIAAKYDFEVKPPMQYNRWLFNMTKPVIKELAVRKALAHIVDYDKAIANIRLGLAERTVSNILPSKPYYNKDIVPYDFNIKKAQDLLAAAGWADANNDGILDKVIDGQSTRLSIELLVTNVNTSRQYAEMVTEAARQAGIEIKSVSIDLTELNPKTRNGDYQTAFLGATLFPGSTEMAQRYHSNSLAPAGDNRSQLINPALDSLIDLISSERDEVKR
ncbi:MAG: hypothetical protein JNJ57_11225, partial [Saprospiraceae bacterium]|nr:hypothetical protein [Saprospiraceae bacterium]